jgi:hypothetical protein
VPRSDNRPHMSVTERRYFRRGSDGTRVLDHGEIRELMFANREARLEINLRLGVSTGDLRFQLNLVLRLRNAGRVPAAAPFLRVKEIGWKLGAGLGDIVSLRTGAERTVGFYASRDVLLHMEDEIGLAEFETGSISGGLGSRPWQVPYRLFASPDCFTRSRWSIGSGWQAKLFDKMTIPPRFQVFSARRMRQRSRSTWRSTKFAYWICSPHTTTFEMLAKLNRSENGAMKSQ